MKKIQLTLAILAAALSSAWHRLTSPDAIALANIADGTHGNGVITRKADAAISTRYLIGKIGTDAAHVDLCGASDIPLGVIEDEASAAEELVPVKLFGSGQGTSLVVASAAISAGAFVVPATGGKVRTLPATTGTYYIIGRALQAAGADGDQLEIDPIPVTQRVVA
jgi:hypothetical protein